MTQSRRYRLYIDESGDHTYNLLEVPEHLVGHEAARGRATNPPSTWSPQTR